tara:strand:- start:9 stop:293 length:285 start_codon:yes stop_codon:yes gene_type:complete
MTNPEHKKQYKKYIKILPQQRKFLQQRQGELKEVLEMKEQGYRKFLSEDNIVDIKFAVFKRKGKELISFIELKIDELENCIKEMEEYVEEYEND